MAWTMDHLPKYSQNIHVHVSIGKYRNCSRIEGKENKKGKNEEIKRDRQDFVDNLYSFNFP